MEGANEVNSPVIVQASAGARKYAGPKFLKSLMAAAVEEFPPYSKLLCIKIMEVLLQTVRLA